MMKLLFVTWDGPDTTYHETLFLPLLSAARSPGDEVGLLQFTWGASSRTRRLAEVAARAGIKFEAVEVPRGRQSWGLPWMLALAVRGIRKRVREGRTDTVMARSIIPGAIAVAASRSMRESFDLIYDADGLPADERIEFGGWKPRGPRYRTFRRLERAAVRRADVVLTRTRKAVDILAERSGQSNSKFVVVVNGKDESLLGLAPEDARVQKRMELGIPVGAPVLVYAGSIGPQYRPEFMLATFRSVLACRSDACFVVLTPRRNHALLRSLAADVPDDRLIVSEVAPSEVPALLSIGDVGLAYREPTLSQQAVAPIKVAEYLLSGLPVAYTAGIGDLETQLSDDIAFATDGVAESDATRVASWLTEDILPNRSERRARARELGVQEFSLSVGVAGYRTAFQKAKEGR